MTKAQRERDRKYKIWMFLSAYSLFVIIKFITDLAQFNLKRNPNAPQWPSRFSSVSTVLLWGVCFTITMTTDRRKFSQSRMSRASVFLFLGFYVWAIWGAFTNFSGISFSGGWDAYREFIVIFVFTHTLYMTVRIVKIYDIRRHMIGATILILGAMLLYEYISHFRGFDFVDSLSNLFKSTGRYRYAYGFRHVNTAGRICIMFMIYTVMYSMISREDISMHKIRSNYSGFFFALFPAVIIILLSTASRPSISALMLLCSVYFFLNSYSRTRMYTQAMYVIFVASTVSEICLLIDWEVLWDIFWSSRGINYKKTLPFLTDRNLWAAGVGMLKRGQIDKFIGTGVMDSFYLTVLLQTGLIGFFIFFVNIFIFVLLYFSDMRHMTRLQQMTGGLIALIIYYGLFEGGMFFGHGPLDLLNWTLIILCMNEKSARKKNIFKLNLRNNIHKAG